MKLKNGRGVPQEKGETWCKGGEAIRMEKGEGKQKEGMVSNVFCAFY